MAIQKPRGTRDLLPDEMRSRRWAEKRMRHTAERFGYGEVATPTFETLELFVKKSGPGIISEVYDFKDKGGREMALRPELTASVVRMAIESMTHLPKPIRVFYMANCFRYDRPQKGRYREFFQFGAELLGDSSDLVDAEVIDLACSCLSSIGVTDLSLKVGNISIIRALLDGWDVPPEKQTRTLQILDKNDIGTAKTLLKDVLDDERAETLAAVVGHTDGGNSIGIEEILKESPDAYDAFLSLKNTCSLLEGMGWRPEMDLSVVRGLDYYTGMVFEMEVASLGAEKQVCGGGAYSLGRVLGGPDLKGCGFAIGFDRVLLTIEQKKDERPPSYLVIPLVHEAVPKALEVAAKLRNEGRTAIMGMEGRSVGKSMKYANAIGADHAVIIGEDEIASGKVSVKDLGTGKQVSVDLSEL